MSSLDETTCERDQTFLSQLDTDYTDGTNYLNQQTADATYAQSRRLVGPYIKELQGYVKRLRSTATSAEYTPVRLGFLHGIQEIIKGLHLEYHNDGSSEAVQRGVDLSDQGFAELSTAYTALFDVSRRSCPGSTLALQSPGAG